MTYFQNILSKSIKLLKFIVFSKFIYSLPPKTKFLLFDGESKVLIRYLPKNYTHTLYTRGEIFNIRVLLKNFLNFKFKLIEYFETYISLVNPKFLITYIDNNTLFYKLKKNQYGKKIFIQNAWRSEQDDTVILNRKIYKKNFKNLNFYVDYMLVFNNKIGEIYNSFIRGKTYVIGSFKSNSYKVHKKKKFGLLYISSWNNIDDNEKITNFITWKKFNNSQSKLIKNLAIYSKKYEKKLYILGKRIQKELSEKEKKYYESLIKDIDFKFIPAYKVSSYKTIDFADISITLNSTLGYESLSRGNKVVFFSTRPPDKSLRSLKFGWPVKLRNKGLFWTNNGSFKECEKILNRVFKVKQSRWDKIAENYSSKLMGRDYLNTRFKKLCGLRNY